MEVVVAVVGSRIEAEMMVGMLRAHELRARVSADDAGGVELALQAQGVRVMVHSEDEAEARELIDEVNGA